MTHEQIISGLRALTIDNRARADLFDEAIVLHETGYQIDQARIDADAASVRAAVAAQIATLENDKVSLTAALGAANAEIQALKDRNERVVLP